jgi:hypothetical protein
VRSTQKDFRVMTRRAEEEARIYVLIPADLPALPVLPTELFGRWLGDYECGELIARERQRGVRSALSEAVGVAGVRVRQRIVHHERLALPALGRGDRDGLLRVLASCPDFSCLHPCGPRRFRSLRFSHPLYAGSGYGLLRWLGYGTTTDGYRRFLAEALGELLGEGTEWRDTASPGSGSTVDDATYLLSSLPGKAPSEASVRGFAAGFRALAGPAADEDAELQACPEQQVLRAEERRLVQRALGLLPPRKRRILAQAWGLHGQRARTFAELGALEGITRSRAQSLAAASLEKLRRNLAGADSDEPPAHDREEGLHRRLFLPLVVREPPASPKRLALYVPHEKRRPRARPSQPLRAQWWAMPRSLAPTELAPLLRQLAAGLGLHTELRISASGAAGDVAACCETQVATGLSMHITAIPYSWIRHEGGEAADVELQAVVAGFQDEGFLHLVGHAGAFHAWLAFADSSRAAQRVDTAWIEGLDAQRSGRADRASASPFYLGTIARSVLALPL